MTNEQKEAIEEAANARYEEMLRTFGNPQYIDYSRTVDRFTEGAQEVINSLEKYGLQPKRRFIVAEIRDLLNQLTKEEISFSRFVEILNETNVDPK